MEQDNTLKLPSQWIVITGNVVEGLKFHGPFRTDKSATLYGANFTNSGFGDYAVVELVFWKEFSMSHNAAD